MVSGWFGGGSKGPSQSEIIAAQEAAAKKERERLATEAAEKDAETQAKLQAEMKRKQSKRLAFASGEGIETQEDEESSRKKFLKAV